MKTAKQPLQSRNETSVTRSMDISIHSTRDKRPTKIPIRRQRKTTEGRSDTCSIEKNKHSPSEDQAFSEQLPVIGKYLPETTNPVPTVKQEPKQSSARIKVQLFPIDVFTQKALEKGGYNPHLELTLSKQKKISSVLRHLKSKWGSVYSDGDIMLFPYNIQLENLAEYRRWTPEDTDTIASDVYEAIGSPSLFRLRYGWFCSVEPMTLGASLASSWSENYLQNENIKQGGSRDAKIAEFEKQAGNFISKECTPISTSDSPNAAQDEFIQSDRVDEPLDNPRTGLGLAPPSLLWADNISIGGLLSEASLHAAPNQIDPVAVRSDSSLQQIPFSCDSFDAAIAAHIKRHSQGPQRTSNSLHSSLLDAEETCHAFPFQKFASSGKDIITSSKSAPFSSIQEVKSQAGVTQNHTCQEIKQDSNSLGMTGINWGDSLVPFDLSLSRRLTSGDSISLSGFLGNSTDAFHNLFGRDKNVAPT